MKKTIEVAPNYGITSLTKPSGSDPLVEITVPKGSHAAFVTGKNHSSELIIERGAGIEVTNVTKILDGNQYRIKIEVRIISSDEMRNKKQNVSNQLNAANEMLTQKLGLNVTLDSVNPDLSTIVNNAYDATSTFKGKFDDLFSSGLISNKTNGEAIFHRLKENGLKITFHEEALSITAQGGSEFGQIVGGYSPELKEIKVDSMMSKTILPGTIAHEFGHAIDDLYFNYQLGKDPELAKLFSKDKEIFAKSFDFDIEKYYKNASEEQKVHEFFAEAFAKFVMDNQKLKEIAPDTY
ncbi:anthrax toxin lethal factor-related metalloendopeptidase, partial [Bacillus cereus]|uniref:anthrax toxin lethal factor-related metalloendopeptidase n=1 Tax=Bacillus cereus TaxID=1396 RepID=UPI001E51223A